MCKEGWCVVDQGRKGLREGGGTVGAGTEKRGWISKDFEKEGASWIKG